MIKPAIYFTDLHTNKYSQFSEHHDRLKDCLKVIDDVFKYAIHYKADTILFGGDLGDLPKWVYIEVIDELCMRFAKWFKKCPDKNIYAISGNHDHNKKNYWEKPAKTLLNVFKVAFPGRFILIDNKLADLGDNCFVAGIPYYEHKACFDKALDEMHDVCLFPNYPEAKVTLLIHQTPEGIYNKYIKADTSPADPRYEVFDMIWDGHIHTKQIITPKFVIGGNGLHRDLGDIGDEKGVWLTDMANPTDYEFLSRKGRYPEFIRLPYDKITEELQQSSFIVPTLDRHSIIVEGSADTTMFNASLDRKQLITNFWKQANGTDERLLNIGLSLCE